MRPTLYNSFMVTSIEKLVPPPTSVASDTGICNLSAAAKSNKPLPRNRLEVGHTVATDLVAAMRARSASSSQIQWANRARSRIRPQRS